MRRECNVVIVSECDEISNILVRTLRCTDLEIASVFWLYGRVYLVGILVVWTFFIDA